MKEQTGGPFREFTLFLRVGSMSALSDDELLTHVVSSDHCAVEAAFATLVHRHGPMVYATCRGVLRHDHDAEDAFQATFLVLARRARSLRHRDRLGPWLHRVAVRASGQARLGAARRREREIRTAEWSNMTEPRPECALDREELSGVVQQEVDRLPDPFRLVVVLCELQGESYETAAARLGVPIGTVRSRLSRARERLRVQITRRGVVVPAGLAFLVGGQVMAAAPPASLITSTVGLAAPATVRGFSAVPAGVAGVAYAQKVLKASSLFLLGKVAAIVGIVGVCLAIVGFGLVSAGADKPQRANPLALNSVVSSPAEHLSPDAQWMQGRWVVVNAEQRGRKLDILIDARLDIDGDRFNLTANGGDPEHILPQETTRGRLSLEPTTEPRRLELIELGRTVRGLYRLNERDQRLMLCLDNPDDEGWPRELVSNQNSGQLLLVLRRDGLPGRHIELPNRGDALTPKDDGPP
jgi:RNA polymerase sigma factor (sigma-70 family)